MTKLFFFVKPQARHANTKINLMCTYTYGASLTLPAVKVTMGRKIMPSLASGTFAQTAASTAMTAPDYG